MKYKLAWLRLWSKVEQILKDNLDFTPSPSPSPSVKIQIMGEKFCLSWKGKTLLGVVNKLLKTKTLLISASNILSYYLICFKPGHFVVKISLNLNTNIDNPQPKSCQYEYSALYAKLNRGHYNEFPLQQYSRKCQKTKWRKQLE